MAFKARSLNAVLFLCLLFCGLIAKAVGQEHYGKSASAISGNWAVGSIQTSHVTASQVMKLLGSDYDDVGAKICDYAFADIAGDGFYRLLVTVDISGRHLCNDLEIIARNGTAQGLFVDQVDHIADILVKGVGHDVLRLPQAFTEYDGYRCRAIVPIYYKFSGGRFVPAPLNTQPNTKY
jgi:hypothetical protein